ncbi:MAG: peptidyl-prolyl cis-trans isomerase [Acidobacteria bacterium]|nr:MAG: peptidyl-prolyl cis-trans isomerase [Acidobacteriota bacterium]REK00475.1 MAG: peptidyl-prolyl cis-trans isomerase [Acidobacteriota bacterium]
MAARPVAALVVVGLVSLQLACDDEPTRFGPGVVARIDGEDLTYDDFELYLTQLGEDPTSLEGAVMAALFSRFLDDELLVRLARERELLHRGDSPLIAAEVLLAARADPAPSEEEIAARYAADSERFVRPERVELRQMLLTSREQAEAAASALASGVAWEQVALDIASDPAGEVTTELSRDELSPKIAAVVFATPAGEITPIVEEEYGFHLFAVDRRMPAGKVPLAEARGEIAVQLRREAADRAYRDLLEEAWSRYNVEVARTNLPFVVQDDLTPSGRDAGSA